MTVLIKKENWFIIKGEKKPCIECTKCGAINLGDNAPHRIESNGSVKNSVVCYNCDFHKYVKLEDWQGGEIS